MQTKLLSPKDCVEGLLASGMTTTEISRSLGCTRGVIDNILLGGDTSYKKADRLRELFDNRKDHLRELVERLSAGAGDDE